MKYAIGDRQPLSRLGMRASLADQGDLRLVAEAADAGVLLAKLAGSKPELLITDLDLSGMSPEEWLPRVRLLAPQLRILISTASRDRSLIQLAVSCAVQGYVLKTEGVLDFAQAVRCLATGETWFSPEILSKVLEARSRVPRPWLTPREVEVLKLVRLGRSNHHIAQILGLADQTVCNYVRHIFAKLNVSRIEVALWSGAQLRAVCAL